MYSRPWRSSIILCRPVAIRDHPTVGPWRSSIVLCRSFAVRDYPCQSMAISDRPLSVREDQSSSVVIHGQSVAIQYHPMPVREDQSSWSFVSLYTRGWDCQISRQDTDKQTSKITRKITKFLDLGAQKHHQRNIARLLHFRLSLRRKRRLSAAQRRSAISPSQRMKFSAEIFNFAHYRRTKFSSISR